VFIGGVVDDVWVAGAVVAEVVDMAGGRVVDGGTNPVQMEDEGDAAAPEEEQEDDESSEEGDGAGWRVGILQGAERAETFAKLRI